MAVIPLLDLQYQEDHRQQDARTALAAVNIISFIATTLILLLRLYSRRVSKFNWEADDWTLIAAWVLYIGLTAICLPHQLGGRHLIVVGQSGLEAFFKSLFGWMILYSIILSLVKISLILLYRRLFAASAGFQMATTIYIIILTMAGIGGVFSTIFMCAPVNAFWDKTIASATCLNAQEVFFGWTIVGLVTDLVTLVFPMPLIWQMTLPLRQKLFLSIVFFMGGMTCISTCFKIWAIQKVDMFDVTWTFTDADYWTHAEIVLCFVCACLPTMGPLLRKRIDKKQIRIERTPTPSDAPPYDKDSRDNSRDLTWPLPNLPYSNPEDTVISAHLREWRDSTTIASRSTAPDPEIELPLKNIETQMDVKWIERIGHE